MLAFEIKQNTKQKQRQRGERDGEIGKEKMAKSLQVEHIKLIDCKILCGIIQTFHTKMKINKLNLCVVESS